MLAGASDLWLCSDGWCDRCDGCRDGGGSDSLEGGGWSPAQGSSSGLLLLEGALDLCEGALEACEGALEACEGALEACEGALEACERARDLLFEARDPC